MSTINDSDLLLVNRGGKDFKVEASKINDVATSNDYLVVSRSGSDYKVPFGEILNCQDTDLFLINSNNVDRSVSGKDLKEYLDDDKVYYPWDDSPGVIWHIKNASAKIFLNVSRPGHSAWDPDGTNPRKIRDIAAGEDVVFVSGINARGLFLNNGNTVWEWGEFQDTKYVRYWDRMFEGCDICPDVTGLDTRGATDMNKTFRSTRKSSKFNQDISGWDVSNVTNMDYMFSGCTEFNVDIAKWNTSNVLSMRYMFENCYEYNRDLSQWCVSKIEDDNHHQGFDQGVTSWTEPKPEWGTCPRGEDQDS